MECWPLTGGIQLVLAECPQLGVLNKVNEGWLRDPTPSCVSLSLLF